MAFSFGFSGDDFEVETNGNDPMDHDGAPVENSVTEPTMRPELHKLEDLVSVGAVILNYASSSQRIS
jgi:hypothetical protein